YLADFPYSMIAGLVLALGSIGSFKVYQYACDNGWFDMQRKPDAKTAALPKQKFALLPALNRRKLPSRLHSWRRSEAMIAEPTDATSEPTELSVKGMTCGNCARHVAESIRGVPEVAGASVELEKGRATVRWKNGPNLDAVVKA